MSRQRSSPAPLVDNVFDIEHPDGRRRDTDRVGVDVPDAVVDLRDELAYLRFRGRRCDALACFVDFSTKGDRGWRVRHVLALQLLADPPQLVPRPVEVGEWLAVPRQVIEFAPLTRLSDLLLDPRLPRHAR